MLSAIELIRRMLLEMNLTRICLTKADIAELSSAVNLKRLSNNPSSIIKDEIVYMCKNITSIHNNKGTTYWVTGLSGAGKTTIGTLLYEQIKKNKNNIVLLDGDILRQVYKCTDYSIEGRIAITYQNSRLCKMLNEQGIDVVICVIAMYDECRQWNRENIANYKEIYLEVPIEILIKRDSKGLYAKALRKEIFNVYGIDLPFEEPKNPDIKIINDAKKSPTEVCDIIMGQLNLK